MNPFSNRSFEKLILILLLFIDTPAFGEENIDRKSLLILAKDWKYAAIYSLSSDGSLKIFSKLKGLDPKIEIPMGKLEYSQHFLNSSKQNQNLLFIFILLNEVDNTQKGEILQTRTRSMKIVSFGGEDEIMKSMPLSYSLLTGKSSDLHEKRVFTVPHTTRQILLIEAA